MTPFFILLTCGQDITVETLVGVQSLIIQCRIFNGTQPLIMEVFKDGELIRSNSLTLAMLPPSDDDFGTYTFALSTEGCGSTSAVSRIIRQGQFWNYNFLNWKLSCRSMVWPKYHALYNM